ncbi:MAG: serine protease [Planctomycetes bacterium]|nr:serine protease [Planctomycetota bacterium]
MRARLWLPLWIVGSALAAWGATARVDGSVVTLVDYFDLGERRVAAALAAAEGDAERISTSRAIAWERAVVRVRVQHSFHGDAHSTTHATGALIRGGKQVATVAHEIVVAEQLADAKIEIVLWDGRVVAGRKRSLEHYVPERPETDWACIDVVDGPTDLPSLELGEPAGGERLVLGFPGRCGRADETRVVQDDAGKALPLRPLRILCRANAADALTLVAGCVPIGGISGAPCVDARGRLVSIQRGVTESVAGDETTWTLNVVPVAPLVKSLAGAGGAK